MATPRKGPRACRLCGSPTSSARAHYCAAHQSWAQRYRQHHGPRPSGHTAAEGYGGVHQKLRKQWAVQVDRGQVACARCGGWIAPGTPWDLGHHDFDRSQYTGPEHAACNRATSGRSSRRQPRIVRPPAEAWL